MGIPALQYPRSTCTTLDHAADKLDPIRWAACAPLGTVDGLEYRNCPVCNSTLGRPTESRYARP